MITPDFFKINSINIKIIIESILKSSLGSFWRS